MNTVSFESPVTTYLSVSRTSCVPTTSRIFLRSLDRDQSSHRYRCYLYYRHAIRSCSKVSRTARCFTASIIFYTSSGIFAGSRLNEHDFDSFCALIISRFERRSWTLTLKKKKKSENDEIWSARRKVDSCCWSRWTSLRFALICTKVKLSKGRGNWNSIESVNKEREILYQIFFKGVRLEDYQIYRSKRREWL